MKASPQLQSLVSQMPDRDDRGTYANIDKDKVEKAIAGIHQGGRENVLGLIDMLLEPGAGDDYKAHYALHCLGVYVTGLAEDGPRREFALALASQIGGDRPRDVQGYLVQELQIAGGKEVLATLRKALADEQLCEPAARALVAIGEGAAEQFRAALPKAGAKCRLTIVQNLGAGGDAGSIGALREALGDDDPEIRLAAARGLADLGDAGSVDLLLVAANTDGWERIRATDACLSLAEKLLAAGKKAEAVKIYSHLKKTRTDAGERYIRDAAERGLAAAK